MSSRINTIIIIGATTGIREVFARRFHGLSKKCFDLLDPSTISPDAIASEITTNLTVPSILVHYFAPHLLKLAQAGNKTTIFLNSSTLAYIPMGSFPSYIAPKAGIAALARVLRQQVSSTPRVASKNKAVFEIVPP
ncbi:hypothetical protein SLS53_004336 [Cytospora paraplurivora]|uniref:Uncharacterized protein n=1 Tax=Cytospora paraplurivora TaxID=2898453 RepID=A0AAN9UAJ4_9PEZI